MFVKRWLKHLKPASTIYASFDQVQRWIQAPDWSRGEKEKFQKFQAPGFIRGVNPKSLHPKSKIQNPKSLHPKSNDRLPQASRRNNMSRKHFNSSGTGDTDSESDHRLSMVDLLTLPDFEQQIVTWMMRQREVSLAEAVAYMNQDRKIVSNMLSSLSKQGFVQELNTEGELRYRPCLSPKQRSR